MIHREGFRFLFVLYAAVGIISFILWSMGSKPIALYIFMAGGICLLAFFTQFFRNPKRTLTQNENLFVSPADGTVVVIEKVFESEYLNEERIQVSIFMSPFNVHLNRVPISGKLEYYKYHEGKYLIASHPKSSTENERNTAVVTTPNGTKFLFRQIAGFVARRIVFFHKEGAPLVQGSELGFIKFGSRMDMFLPLNAELNIKLGDTCKAGVTFVAKLS
ncbi:MAG: phosphatidylserine decarboxylase family protein [Bacteroidetes bacterium]|nr:phosphatidylserine decarboxylase family protein [Bacteroidota bacterium]